MTWLTKLAIGLGLMAVSFGAGYYTHTPETVVRTETQVQQVEHVVTKTVTKVVKAPDGTVTTETAKETTENSTQITHKDTPAQPVAGSARAAPVYSLQVNWTPRLDIESYKPTGVEFGRRLGDTGAWAVGGYDWRTKEITAALRLEF